MIIDGKSKFLASFSAIATVAIVTGILLVPYMFNTIETDDAFLATQTYAADTNTKENLAQLAFLPK